MPDQDLNRKFEELKQSLRKEFKKTIDGASKVAADARKRIQILEKKIADLMRRPK